MNSEANDHSGAGPTQSSGPGVAVSAAQTPGPPISVRSPVNDAAVREAVVALRKKLLTRWSGRLMQRRLLDGAGFDRDQIRARKCGYRVGNERIFLVGKDGRARVQAARCGQNRICSVCGPALAAVRAAQCGAVVWRWMTSNEERCAVFVSTTASHRASDRLEDHHRMWIVARSKILGSRNKRWLRVRAELGIADVAWKIEHSIGPNGPHVGLHMVFLTDRWWTAEDADRAEAWLWVEFSRELKAAGFTGRFSADQGIDIRPVDDPERVARYMLKWGVGSELVAEADKLGRNGVNVPLTAIPAVLADQLGRLDPWSPKALRNPDTRRMVHAWADFVRLATGTEKWQKQKWYGGFHTMRDMVPELNRAHTPPEIIAVCTEVLPAECRPERFDDSELEEDDEDGNSDVGAQLRVDGEAWEVCQMAWWRPDRLPWIWAVRRRRWLDGHVGATVPLELAVAWVIEDEGLDIAASALASLCEGRIWGDELGLWVALEGAEGPRRQAAA